MDILLKAGRFLYALSITVFGIQHFLYASYVATLVPGWVPWHLFWVYFVGIALIAAAVSIAIGKKARLACVLLGAMIFLFIVLIQAPVVVASAYNAGKIGTMFDQVGLGCCAFILGGTFPK